MSVEAKRRNNHINNSRELWGVVGKMRERLARLEAEMAIGLAILVCVLAKLLFA